MNQMTMMTLKTTMREMMMTSRSQDAQMSPSLNFFTARREGIPMEAKRVRTTRNQTTLQQRRRDVVPMPRMFRKWSWEEAWREHDKLDSVEWPVSHQTGLGSRMRRGNGSSSKTQGVSSSTALCLRSQC